MATKLTPTQANVMRWANGGWTLQQQGNVYCANGERLCQGATIRRLVQLGLLKKVNYGGYRAVETNRERQAKELVD